MDAERPSPLIIPANERLPHWLQATLEEPAPGRWGWMIAIAPTYIGLFLWVVFYDQLPGELLSQGGLGWGVLGCGLGGLLGFLLLYLAPTWLGFTSGWPLAVVTTGPFGVRGAAWVPLLPMALAQLVWLGVAIGYGTDLCLRGLVLIDLLAPRYLAPMSVGGITLESPLFLVTALLWGLCVSLAGRWLVRIIAALMYVYPVVLALMLGAAALAALGGLPTFRPEQIGGASGARAGLTSVAIAVQMILAFFATSGLASVDWGASSRTARDVRLGGFVSVALASWIIATLALLAVAGAVGRSDAVGLAGSGRPGAIVTFHEVLVGLFGRRLAGVMDLGFGLASLAPGVNAAYFFGSRMNALCPRVSWTRWTLIGVVASWLLIAVGAVFPLLDVFGIVGGLLAPAIGVLTADFLRSRGQWSGGRRAINPPGLIAWAIGAIVGLAPTVGAWLDAITEGRGQPGVLWGYLTSLIVYLILATAGLETPIDPRLTRCDRAPESPEA